MPEAETEAVDHDHDGVDSHVSEPEVVEHESHDGAPDAEDVLCKYETKTHYIYKLKDHTKRAVLKQRK